MAFDRRQFLGLVGLGSLGLGLPQKSSGHDPILVLVILRGGWDALAVMPRPEDPQWLEARGTFTSVEGAVPLADGFALAQGLAPWKEHFDAGELLPMLAMGLPLLNRSHFAAQDCLETGGPDAHTYKEGWLYRALDTAGCLESAAALSANVPLVLQGERAVTAVKPGGADLQGEALAEKIATLLASDPMIGPALQEGLATRARLAGRTDASKAADAGAQAIHYALQAAGQLPASGSTIMVVEGGGWDTHLRQGAELGRRLNGLREGVGALRVGLGDRWRNTVVAVVSEFGRAVKPNGSNGTDHGAGGLAFLLGGAVAGGKIRGEWPGLSLSDRYEGRDLRPTGDLRALFAGLLIEHLHLPEQAVAAAFPEIQVPMTGLVRQA
jgi:uncharacterized protein (DUF1501 family)